MMTVAIAMQASIRDARELADRYPNVPLLEIEALNIVDLKFLGGTVWTDVRIRGHDRARWYMPMPSTG